MKRSNWVRLIAVILIISMMAAPVSAATVRPGADYGTNSYVGSLFDRIRDIIRDIIDDWFDRPDKPVTPRPTEPVAPPVPSEPGVTEPVVTDPTEPVGTDPTKPVDPSEPEDPTETPKTDLELVEGHENTKNGHLLRGVTYTLSQVISEQNQAPVSHVGLRKPIQVKPRNPISGLSVNAVTTTAAAEATKKFVDVTNADSFDGTKQYILVSERSETEGLLTTETYTATLTWGSRLKISGLNTHGTVSTDTTELWTIAANEDGTYAIKHGNQYLTLDYNRTANTASAGLTDTATGLYLQRNGNYWYITNAEAEYLSNVGGFVNGFYGAAGFNEQGGSGWQIRELTTTEPEQPETDTKLVYFPVTMFNYDMDTMNEKTISMYEEGFTLYSGMHFSNGTPANKDSVTYAVTAHTGEYTNGQYVIQNYLMKDNNQPSWLTYTLEGEKGITSTSNQADAAIWTLTRRPGANVFTLTTEIDGTTYYMTLGNETSGVTTDYSEITLVHYTHTNTGIQITKDGYYLGHSEDNLFCGNTNSNSTSNGMGFFPVAEDGTIGTTARTVTTINGAVTSGFSRWNWWSYLEDGNAAQNKFFAELVQHELDKNGDIVFNVIEPGIFKTGTGENIADKDVYTNVGLPFVLDETTGIYSFNSDLNGVYFPDKDGDGDSDPASGTETKLELLKFDLGAPQGWSGMHYGDGSSKLWAPFNTNVNDDAEGHIDYHFGMRADIPFSMTPNGRIKSTDDTSKPISFTFSGDDDVWVFIDGHLVIDLGGIHNRIGATIDFANNTITYFLPESNTNTAELGCYNDRTRYPVTVDENGKQTITVKLYNDAQGEGSLGQTRLDFSSKEAHTMSIFYMERGMGTSNCHIEFNLPMRDTVLVTKDITKSWSEEQDANDGENDGTALLTAKEQAAVDKLDFYFKLYKKEANGETSVVANTNFYLQDKTGKVLAIPSTGPDGLFSLKNGQTAKFMTEMSKDGVTYYVEEVRLDLNTFLTPDYNYRGVATNGFHYEGYALDTDSEVDNATEYISADIDNAGNIPEHELPMNATVLKSYDITAYGSIESIDSLEFICTNYLNADLPLPTARAYEDIIVIDYGLPVKIDPLHNDLFRGDDIEIVAWGDESLTLDEVLSEENKNYAVPDGTEGGTRWTSNELPVGVTAARLGSNANYDGNVIDAADCLFTFTKNEDNTWVVSSTDSNGSTVYLQPYASNNGYPVVSESQNVTIGDGATEGTITLRNSTGFLFFYRDGKNYFDRVASSNGFESGISFFLYAEQEDGSYAPISGKDSIVDGEKYLIVADAGSHGKFITYPTTSRENRYAQIAKLSPADNSYAFKSGNVTFKDVTYSENARDTFEYRLTEQMTEVEVINYIIKVNSTVNETVGDEVITKTGCRYALGQIYIVPATIMYYEENFSDFVTFSNNSNGNAWGQTVVTNGASDFQEPGVVGTATDSTYGSDEAYLHDSFDSNGTSRYADTTDGALRFSYTFTGTGTSIFARTSATTGYIQVKLYEGAEASGSYKTYYRDTYYHDENGIGQDNDKCLYNIPVYTIEDLTYGTYTIVCTVAKAGTPTEGNPNGSGNQFFLDGIRVMQPLNENSVRSDLVLKAQDAYSADGESNLDTVTLREKLIKDAKNGVEWDGENFVVMTDYVGNIITAADYISIGPKEEVYLAPGQKITFSLKNWETDGLKLYLGMKAPFGTGTVNVGNTAVNLENAPDCYYDITNYGSTVPVTENGVTYNLITYSIEVPSDANCIVSLTNLKVVGNYEFTIVEKD